MKRVLSTLLLVSMMATMSASCGDKSNNTTDTSVDLITTTAAPEETDPVPDLPDDLKYPGETVTIISAEGVLASEDELSSDINALTKAMYDRTLAVEERFDIDFEFVNIVPWGNIAGMVRQSVNAGSDDYQLVFTCASGQVNLVNEGLYFNIDELPYIDLEKPWWNKQYIESVSLNEEAQYILFGDITYNTLQRTTCVFFNIQLLENRLGMSPEDIYEIVYNGEWTIDKFTELVSQVYEDDGNTVNDINDVHGLVYLDYAPFNWMAFSSGLKFTSRDEDGYPEINVNNEQTVDMLDKLCKLFFDNPAVYSASTTNRNEFAEAFNAGKSLFLINRFYMTDWEHLREMKDDYGILPMPKYSEEIDGYHSTVEGLVQWGAVPLTVKDPVMISAVAEALAYESYMRTTPAYYESTLKLKQTRDEASMEMIDMIMEGRDTDFLFINPLGGLGNIFVNVYKSGQNNFASIYASLETAGETALQNLIYDYKSK